MDLDVVYFETNPIVWRPSHVAHTLAVPKFGDERGVRHHEDVLLVHNAVLHASLHDVALTTQLVSSRVDINDCNQLQLNMLSDACFVLWNAKASVDTRWFYSFQNLVRWMFDARIRHSGSVFTCLWLLGHLGHMNPPLRWKQPTMSPWATTINRVVWSKI